MGKGGVSAIVAVVLMVFIASAAVMVVFMGVSPILQEEIYFDDVTLRLSFISTGANIIWDEENRLVMVQVERGSDEVDLIGLNLIFVFDNETVKYFDLSPEANLNKMYYINLTGSSGKLLIIRVSPVFSLGEGVVRDEIKIEDIKIRNLTELINLGEISEEFVLANPGADDSWMGGETMTCSGDPSDCKTAAELVCKLKKVRWSINFIEKDKIVGLITEGESCEGKKISYKIIKKGEFGLNPFNWFDKIIFEEIAGTSMTWHAGLRKNGDIEEGTYYFKAVINNGLSGEMISGNLVVGKGGDKKELMLFNNPARLSDYTIDEQATLDIVEGYHGNSYSYLLCSGPLSLDDEYNEAEDSWPGLERLLIDAQKRDINIWVTYISPYPIATEGWCGSGAGTYLYRDWIVSMAKLSKKYSVFQGVIMDDFYYGTFWSTSRVDSNGQQIFTLDYLKEMYGAMKVENPNFKFYPLLYWQGVSTSHWPEPNPVIKLGLIERVPYFDGVVYFFRDGSRDRGVCDPALGGSDFFVGDGCDDEVSSHGNARYWDTFEYEIDYVKTIFDPDKVIAGAYIVGRNDPPREDYTEAITRLALEETAGFYQYYMIRDVNVMLDDYCIYSYGVATLNGKKGCILKKIFSDYE
jgi:hypothetical protein